MLAIAATLTETATLVDKSIISLIVYISLVFVSIPWLILFISSLSKPIKILRFTISPYMDDADNIDSANPRLEINAVIISNKDISLRNIIRLDITEDLKHKYESFMTITTYYYLNQKQRGTDFIFLEKDKAINLTSTKLLIVHTNNKADLENAISKLHNDLYFKQDYKITYWIADKKYIYKHTRKDKKKMREEKAF
jgi:hypothetical protein